MMPLAKDPMTLVLASAIQGSISASILLRTIEWNLSIRQRASTRSEPCLDRRDCHGVGLGQMVPGCRHQPRDRPGRRHLLQLLIRSAFGPPSAGCPLCDYAQGTAKAFGLQASPELSAVAAARSPDFIQQWQLRIQRTLPKPEHISAHHGSPGGQACGYGRFGARSP